eukprot:5132482-Amphidinium_carterae.1
MTVTPSMRRVCILAKVVPREEDLVVACKALKRLTQIIHWSGHLQLMAAWLIHTAHMHRPCADVYFERQVAAVCTCWLSSEFA